MMSIMITYYDLLTLRSEIYKVNEANGFWKDGTLRNFQEALMLVVTELSEAVEAHRKGRMFSIAHKQTPISELYLASGADKETSDPHWVNVFKLMVKDTVEDELADAVIRLLDIIEGYKISIPTDLQALAEEDGYMPIPYDRDEANFAATMFWLTNRITRVGVANWSTLCLVLVSITDLCEFMHIDILTHVKWKFKYNSTRGKMHGGKAY
jgi:hypothetical protein